VAHREEIARVKRRAFVNDAYWGRGVPAFGSPTARVALYGLAPGAHGSNRTGRMFTGDASGDFLFAALHRAGFASHAEGRRADDGLLLMDVLITSTVRCVPPDNKPTPEEMRRCESLHSWREFALLPNLRVVVALGRIAFDSYLRLHRASGRPAPEPVPAFAHGAVCALPRGPHLVCSYHPSRQNTQTGRLTPEMLDNVFRTVRALVR
jgi:uracil-DNA glycosylase family 4